MSSNPFLGLVSSAFKNTFVNAIQSLTAEDSLSLPCLLEFEGSAYTACDNCHYDAVNQRSSGRYKTGGPIAFASGQQCPRCNGAGKIPDPASTTSTVQLIVIYDSRRWLPMGSNNLTAQAANGSIQTLSNADTYDDIRRCNTMLANTDVATESTQKYVRAEEPQRLGLGGDEFVLTMWDKV